AYGTIESARVLNHKNCGFVNFIRLEDAVRAKQAMNGKSIDGMVVRIGYAKVPAAKNESSLKMRNPVPSAAPLTVSGQIAEADAITGTTQCGLGSDMVLEPGFSLAIDEDLVAFPYATQLPTLPEPRVVIRPDPADGNSPSAQHVLSPTPAGSGSGSDDKGRTVLQQSRLREIRKLLETPAGSSPIPRAEFDQIVAELMPHAVDLCTDYVGNVLIQKIAERGSAEQKLELARRVAPHMTAIGVHKNGTWAVQRIIDTADKAEQRRVIVESIRPFTPQLLLDQLGNYVVQCCLKFGAPANDDEGDVSASNQFAYDAIHARCLEIAQGRFGARAIRTCLDSPHVSKLQQKLVAVSLVTNAVSLATNANGHLLMNWLLDSSKLSGRFRVLAHQLAPHLRYLATHKLGASTISKLVDQSSEPDARDLILNTLFFNPDPTVLDDVLLDQAQGIHVVLKILQGNAIGEAEKARIADRLRFVTSEYAQHQQQQHQQSSAKNSTSSSAGHHHHGHHHQHSSPGGSPAAAAASSGGGSARSGSASASQSVAPTQRLADAVAAILAHSQPVYPTVVPHQQSSAAVAGASVASGSIASPVQQQQAPESAASMPTPLHYTMQAPSHMGFHYMPTAGGGSGVAVGAAAMSYPAMGLQHMPPPAGFGGMVAGGGGNGSDHQLMSHYYRQMGMPTMAPPSLPAAGGFFGMDYAAGAAGPARSAMPFYPYGSAAADMYAMAAGSVGGSGEEPDGTQQSLHHEQEGSAQQG
ncbi:hypothetical protein LPJ56_004242, partial [Coemansia sp. RSA 2599]